MSEASNETGRAHETSNASFVASGRAHMDHIAILKDGPLDSILSGKKTIESRWSVNKIAPFGKVHQGDTIFLQRSGGSVEAKASVSKVLEFSPLTKKIVDDVVREYGSAIGIDETSVKLWWNPTKNYCTLIFFDEIKKTTPFRVNKEGFASMAAWLCLPHGIEAVKRKSY